MSASNTSMSSLLENPDRIVRVRCQRYVRAAILERPADELARVLLVVDDEHSNSIEPGLGRFC